MSLLRDFCRAKRDAGDGDATRRSCQAGHARAGEGHAALVQNILDPGRYKMYASLSATLSDGSEVETGVRDKSFSAPRDGLGAIVHRYRGPKLSDDPDEQIRLLQETYHVSYTDVVDHVNQMLGRDPELHRPPRLSWDNLIKALAKSGIDVNEDELIRAPLVRDLSDEVSAEIRADIS
jgi:hypothetical protein